MNIQSLLNSQLNTSSYHSLYSNRDNLTLIKRLSLSNKLEVHNGCVNTISWSEEDSSFILSGSDDQNLCITNAFSGIRKALIHTGHKTNIFSAKFLPKSNLEKIISSSSSGDIYLNDVNKPTILNNLNHYMCHGDKTCYELRTCNDSFNFASCGQDGTVKWFDIRQSSKCNKTFCSEHTLIKISNGITAITINPLIPYHIVCGGLDGILRFYDRRMLSVGHNETDNQSLQIAESHYSKGLFAYFNPSKIESSNSFKNSILNSNSPNTKRITSVQYDNNGKQVLVSYQPDLIYLLDWRDLIDNAEDTNFNINENEKLEKNSSTENNQSKERKFRIQNDWSDTGPNSMPYNQLENNDPRSFLARRLSEWFTNVAHTRSSNNITSSNQENDRYTLNSRIDEQNENNLTLNQEPQLNNQNSSESENNEEQSELNSSSENQTDSRDKFLSLTASFIGSKIKTKHAIKLEANYIKSKPSPRVKMIFSGHRNLRTIIKECNFWGNDYVISGSDCGHLFFWNKNNGKIVNIIEADKRVVNCVQENPFFPFLASSGIDYNIKIWEPKSEFPVEIESKIEQIVKKNKLMLEESKNTIFIPVQFMLPALRLFGVNMGTSTRNSNSSTLRSNSVNNNNENPSSE